MESVGPLQQLAGVVRARVGKQRGTSPRSPPRSPRSGAGTEGAGQLSRVFGPVRAALNTLLPCLLWPILVAVPVALTSSYGGGAAAAPQLHEALFPAAWWRHGAMWTDRPSPLGLCLGLLAVAVGMAATAAYHGLHLCGFFGEPRVVQPEKKHEVTSERSFWVGLRTHLAQPEGFVMLGGYLAGTWLGGFMPASYYSSAGGVQWGLVAAQLLLQDTLQFGMHYAEHMVSSAVYRRSHKPHHRFVRPTLFDAFDGSPFDTLAMILVPLYATALLVPGVNVWSYMAFGALYANGLTLIHSEFHHRWEGLFAALGVGTAGDHHVHHRFFVHNYGHLFTYADRLCGTYRNPAEAFGAKKVAAPPQQSQ